MKILCFGYNGIPECNHIYHCSHLFFSLQSLLNFRVDFLGEILRLQFNNMTGVALDSISGKSGVFINESKTVTRMGGRHGLRVLGTCVLQLPAPVSLTDSGWTISVWLHTPLTGRTWHNLVDGNGNDFIVVTFQNGVLGNYHLSKYTLFNADTLKAGWHHLAVVGNTNQDRTIYYIDGVVVGEHSGVSKGKVRTVGNRGDGNLSESFTLMSDLRIFSLPAMPEHVQKLAMT